jgi:hypothetical protein
MAQKPFCMEHQTRQQLLKKQTPRIYAYLLSPNLPKFTLFSREK